MIVTFVLLIMLVVLGAVLMARGMVPVKPSLQDQLDYFANAAPVDGISSPAVDDRMSGLLKTLHGTGQSRFQSDLRVTGRSQESHASEIAKAAFGVAGVLWAVVVILFGISLLGTIIAVAIGLPVGYLVAEQELRRAATDRREEFEETLVSILSLMAISMEGGGGLNSAIQSTLNLGDGWVVAALRRSIDEANFRNESPWVGLQQLGTDWQIPALIELSSTLSLVGTSGARVAQTLSSRAESARTRRLIRSRVESESKSASMGVPLGVMTIAWVLFLAYPAVVRLLAL